MKKLLHIMSAALAIALIFAGIRLTGKFPLDTQPYVEKKYSGWNGVLRAWVCVQWECAGSFIGWLNRCVASFEREHNGVYIEFTLVSREALRSFAAGSMRPPELLIHSPGVLTDASGLKRIERPDVLREDLACDSFAIPIALGGSIWGINMALSDAPPEDWEFTSKGACSVGLIGLMSGDAKQSDPEAVDPGIDLGLQAAANAAADSEASLADFISGKLPALPLTQKEIAELVRLRDSGRGPDWTLMGTGSFACTDQLLFASIPRQRGADSVARETLVQAFLETLLDEKSQSALADIGVCSVTGRPVHKTQSPYAPLDALLNSRPIHVPRAFSEHSTTQAAELVHHMTKGKLTPEEALVLLGFESG